MNSSNFSSRMNKLFSLLSNETSLRHYDRLLMYKELLEHTTTPELKDLHTDVMSSLYEYYQEVLSRASFSSFNVENNNDLNTMYNVLENWLPKIGKTLYSNPENVHGFSAEAVKIAKEIIRQHPQKYQRPCHNVFNTDIADTYFRLIEEDNPYNGINLTDLFASVWEYIRNHNLYNLFLQRLLEEIKDSVDVCASGRFVRLVNVINGIDERYSFFVQKNEYHKSYIFHLLNKHVSIYDLKNFVQNVQKCVNTNVDLLKATRADDIEKNDVIQILQNYTKTPWYYSSVTDLYMCCKTGVKI